MSSSILTQHFLTTLRFPILVIFEMRLGGVALMRENKKKRNWQHSHNSWSNSKGPRKFGHAKLHDALAARLDTLEVTTRTKLIQFLITRNLSNKPTNKSQNMFQEWGQAARHYLLGSSVGQWHHRFNKPPPKQSFSWCLFVSSENHIRFVQRYAQAVLPSERDLVLARSVLQWVKWIDGELLPTKKKNLMVITYRYLSIENLRDGNILFNTCIAKEDVFKSTPLTRFVGFLLQTAERDAAPLFRTLRKKYDAAIKRDPLFNEVRRYITIAYSFSFGLISFCWPVVGYDWTKTFQNPATKINSKYVRTIGGMLLDKYWGFETQAYTNNHKN